MSSVEYPTGVALDVEVPVVKTGTLDGATEPGPPNAEAATPGEFAARWNAHTDAERQAWLDDAHENRRVAQHCWRSHGTLEAAHIGDAELMQWRSPIHGTSELG